MDNAGNLYIADDFNQRIRKVAAGTGIVTTVAGNGTQGFSGDGAAATSAELNYPTGVAVDSAGNLYIAEQGGNRLRKVFASTGIITTLAGIGTAGFTGDGAAATSAELNGPTGVAVDSAGNLYIADEGNGRIREVAAATGVITTVAGNGIAGFSNDGGIANFAEFVFPTSVAVDSAGNLYIADQGNNRICKVTASTGIITTVAGNGIQGFNGDGAAATSASLNLPRGVALDSDGNLYIGDYGNAVIRKVAAGTGIITTVAGNTGKGFSGDGGLATHSELDNPQGVAVDSAGNLYIADSYFALIRRVDSATGSAFLPNTNVGSSSIPVNVLLQPTTNLTLSSITAAVSQGGVQEYTVGTISGCTLSPTYTLSSADTCVVPITFSPGYPGERDVALTAVTSQGTVSFGLSGIGQGPLATLTPGIISTVAGNGTAGFTGDGAAATSAELHEPRRVTLDSAGNLYIADAANNRIRKVAAKTGVITTVAGNGTQGSSGDGGAATSAELNYPGNVAVDSAGNLYIADTGNHRVRKVAAGTGIITTVAGNGTFGFSGDGGAGTSAELYNPYSAAVDRAGNLYIADEGNNRVRKVAAGTGIITTVAGNGTGGFSGDGAAATSAELKYPSGVAMDSTGNLYITDFYNNRVREVAAGTGVITTVAGNGTIGFSGDGGAATSAELNYPDNNVAVDSAGNLYIPDSYNYRVRKVAAGTGVITTVAGNGTVGFTGDGGAATSAEFYEPSGVALDSTGNLYIADLYNNVIRRVAVNASALSFAATSVGSISSDSPETVSLGNSGNMALTFPAPASGYNPSVSSGDFLGGSASTTCPYEASMSDAGTLEAGAECTFGFYFLPQQSGSLTATATVTDTSIGSATQTISMSGTATTVQPTPAVLIAPSPGSTLTAASTTFTWSAATGNVTYYVLYVGSTPGGHDLAAVSPNPLTGTSATVNLPTNGATIYVRLWTIINGSTYLYNDYTYAEASIRAAAITSPGPGSTLTAASTTFTWSAGSGNVTYYVLWAGSTPGSYDLADVSPSPLTGTSATVNLPTNGATIYVRLWTIVNGSTYFYNDYTYTEASIRAAAITSPGPGSTLTSASTTFTWSAATGNVTYYVLYVGSTPGGHDLAAVSPNPLTGTSATVNLPTNGATIYVRLWTIINGSTYFYNDYTYTEASIRAAAITSPGPGSTLTSASTTFTWSAATGNVTYYVLYVGSTPGSYDLAAVSPSPLTGTSATVNLPTNGATIYVRLWTIINGSTYFYNDYTYTEFQ